MVAPVVVALAVMYTRFVGVERDATELKQKVHDIEVTGRTGEKITQSVSERVSTLEVKQSVVERDLKESLSRIELTIAEIKGDVKDLQKTRGAK